MKIGRDTRRATCLLATTLLAGCATPTLAQEAPASQGAFTAFVGKPSMSADELRDLAGQPPAERRRRLDVVLAAHPGDAAARLLRMRAENELPDFPAVLADSEALLANPAFDRRMRAYVLDARAEALIQLQRIPEALRVANRAVEIDDSDPEALFARGWARYLSDHELAESALADLGRALQLEPGEGIAHYRRAVILQNQGKLELATADLERALQLAPDDGPARQRIGILMFAKWYSGQFRQSIDAFREQAARPEASAYAPIWLFIMRIRANPADEAAARAELATLAPAPRPPDWRAMLVDLMLGKATLEAALAEADAASTDRLRAGQRCEADYYVAEQLLAHGQDLRAGRLLDEAQAVCPSTYIEVGAIAAERRQSAARAPAR